MSKANKRERQRMNREARREYEEALAKRRRLFKGLRNFAIIAIPVLVIGIVISLTNSGGDDTAGASSCADVKTPAAKDVQPTAPPLGIDQNQAYSATLDTTCGTIELALDAQQYPINVNNFVALANQGYYDGLAFVRAAKDLVIQTGEASQTNAVTGPPPYTQQGELPTAKPAYPVGTVAMVKANSDPPGTIGQGYFIVTAKAGARLPSDYAVVGKVTKGQKVAQTIEGFAPTSGDGPLTKPVVVKKVTITTKGVVPPSTTPST